MSLFARYLRHDMPGTGANGPVLTDNPWSAGRVTLLRNNTRHLEEVNYRRSLWTSAGVEGFYRASTLGTSFVDPPSTLHIQWRYARKTGGLALDLGTHYVWRTPSGRWPRLVVRFQTKVASGFTVGVVLAAVAPNDGNRTSPQLGGAYTDTTFTEKELGFNLTDALLLDPACARVVNDGSGTVGSSGLESGEIRVFRAWLGGYCSSDSGSDPASVVGISLSLENPT
mgnify:CR=1 FL=1